MKENSFSCVIALIFLAVVNCEFYSSVHELTKLIDYERFLLGKMERFVELNENKLDLLKEKLSDFEREHKEAQAHFENPINEYLLMQRLSVEWKKLEILLDHEMGASTLLSIDKLRTHYRFPGEDDFDGAIDGMLRLQRIYQLNTKDMAEGILGGVKHSTELSAKDCYDFGKLAQKGDHLLKAHAWLSEALERFHSYKPSVVEAKLEIADILEALAAVKFKLSDFIGAAELSYAVNLWRPNNLRLMAWYNYFAQYAYIYPSFRVESEHEEISFYRLSVIMAFVRFMYLLVLFAAPMHSEETKDFYTSIAGMENFLELEYYLLDNLKEYVIREHAKLHQIDLLLRNFQNESAKALNNSTEYFSSPINVFRTIKRLVVDFKHLESYILEQSNAVEYNTNVTAIKTELEFPVLQVDDLAGAAVGLSRLQKTYQWNTSDMAEGRLLGAQYNPAMTTSEVFYVGKHLYGDKRYRLSFEWLSYAWEKFNEPSYIQEQWDVMDRVKLLEQYSAAAYHAGQFKIARNIANEILLIDPNNKDAYESVKAREMDMFLERNTPKRSARERNVKPMLVDIYETTCRGERTRTPTEERPLRCMYIDNNVPFLKIAPFKLEQLSLDPLIVYYHEAIYENEIEQVLDTAAPNIVRSRVLDGRTTLVSTVRTSKNAWLNLNEHTFLANIRQRLLDMTHLSLDTAEHLQVANYGIGGHYGPHFDFSHTPNESYGEAIGNRIATALFYISDVELGGATAFPYLKLVVKPVRRSLVFWYNLHDSNDPDFRMLHAGCPVIKGSKWILNEWFHERGQEFMRPCGLQSTAYLSDEFKKK